MSKKVLYILGILLTILIGTFLFRYYCCKGGVAGWKPDTEKQFVNKFELTGDGFDFRYSGNFKFPVNGSDIILPAGDSIDAGVRALNNFLNANPSQKLFITGYCSPAEKNGSSCPDLGKARANAVKEYFVSRGIPASRIEILGEMKENLQTDKETVFGPLAFKLGAVKDELTLLKEKLNAAPLVIYFKTAGARATLTAEQKEKLGELAKYLEKDPNAKLNITGYSDNVGERELNMKLGLARANFGKLCCTQNGMDEKRMEVTSKGPDDPAADNSTNEGRIKNRRTVIIIR